MLRNMLLGSLSVRCDPGSSALGPLASLLCAQGVKTAEYLQETQGACALLYSLALAGSAGLRAGLRGEGGGEGGGVGEKEEEEEGEGEKSEAVAELEAWESGGQLASQVEVLAEELEDLRFLVGAKP